MPLISNFSSIPGHGVEASVDGHTVGLGGPAMLRKAGAQLPAELAAGHALIGPHRDDLSILFDGREMRVYGSSGQQRSALLLLDLAAISLYNSWHHDYPLFLIDDVDAELDEKRIGNLLEYLEGRTQTFITTSKSSHIGRFFSQASAYQIEDGAVVQSEGETRSLTVAEG